MTLTELNLFSESLFKSITSENNDVSRTSLLEYILPALNTARLIDSDEVTHCYYNTNKVEVDAFLINDTKERLQIFISNLVLPESENGVISRKAFYDGLFKKAFNLVSETINKKLTDIQVSDPFGIIINHLQNTEFIDQIDVIEIFLISNTISTSNQGMPKPKMFLFEDQIAPISYKLKDITVKKVITIKYQLIDLNRIYNLEISEGISESIIINFDPPLTAIKANQDEGLFQSYLTVIPGELLVNLYHNYSSRLLERNIRSFLQFKGVNKKIKATIIDNPERFVAYNNGLTITATASDITLSGGVAIIHTLTDFQIVNGGQTTASIYFSSKEKIDVSKINVIAKINVVNSEDRENLDDLISKISKYSNSQSKVSSVDLDSRSPLLLKIKKISDAIADPFGDKWFFERIRGEFNTLIRINPKLKAQIEFNYPSIKRLSKEQIAKYYISWGTNPYLVRNGAEKVFSIFMLSLNSTSNENPFEINRTFYEDLIAKSKLFRELEKLYGRGANAIGQIRSSVVPYTIAIFYRLFLVKNENFFDLGSIWFARSLQQDQELFFKKLLSDVHDWLKKYSKSDDVGEYAKKEDLWQDITNSREFKEFENERNTTDFIKKYKLSEADFKKRYNSSPSFDFNLINENCRIHDNGMEFYLNLKSEFSSNLNSVEVEMVTGIIGKINRKKNISEKIISNEKLIVNKLQSVDSNWFNKQKAKDFSLLSALTVVRDIYNENVFKVKDSFQAETACCIKDGIDDHLAQGYTNIGIDIYNKRSISMSDIYKIKAILHN